MDKRVETRGRKKLVSLEEFMAQYWRYCAGEISREQVAEELGMSLSTYHRYLDEARRRGVERMRKPYAKSRPKRHNIIRSISQIAKEICVLRCRYEPEIMAARADINAFCGLFERYCGDCPVRQLAGNDCLPSGARRVCNTAIDAGYITLCEECGTVFSAGTRKARFCPDCVKRKQSERMKKTQADKLNKTPEMDEERSL